MSIQAVGWVLEQETTTSGADRLVLIALANHVGERDGRWECWPSVARIGREAGISRLRTVQEALSRLEAAGLIEREMNAAPDSRLRADRRPTLYRLRPIIPGPARTPVDDDLDGVADSDTPRTPADDHGVTDTAGRGDGLRRDGVTESGTLTVTEPSVNPLPHADTRQALLEVCGLREEDLTTTARSGVERDLRRLLEVDATPNEIRRRAEAYRLKWPAAALTSAALVRHWPRLWRPEPATRTIRVRCSQCGLPAAQHFERCQLEPADESCPVLRVARELGFEHVDGTVERFPLSSEVRDLLT